MGDTVNQLKPAPKPVNELLPGVAAI